MDTESTNYKDNDLETSRGIFRNVDQKGSMNNNNDNFQKESFDPVTFLKEIHNDKREFQSRIKKLKESDQLKQKKKESEMIEERLQKVQSHKVFISGKFERTIQDLKERETTRNRAKLEYQEYLKEKKTKIPVFKQMQNRYDDKKKLMEVEYDSELEKLHNKYKPLDHHDISDHIQKYNAGQEIQELKRREKSLDFMKKIRENNTGYLVTTPAQIPVFCENKQGRTNEEHKIFLNHKKNRDAALEYAKHIQREYQPKLQTKKIPLPIELIQEKSNHRLENLTDTRYQRKKMDVGNKYMEQSKQSNFF